MTLGVDELLAQDDSARIQVIMLTASLLPAQCQEAETQLPFNYMLMFLTDTRWLTRGDFLLSCAIVLASHAFVTWRLRTCCVWHPPTYTSFVLFHFLHVSTFAQLKMTS